jgi:hypothetical protein
VTQIVEKSRIRSGELSWPWFYTATHSIGAIVAFVLGLIVYHGKWSIIQLREYAQVGSKATKMEVFHHVHHIIVVALVAAGCVAVELANAVEGSKDNRKFLVPTARDGTGFILQVDTLDTSELQDINTQLLEKKGPRMIDLRPSDRSKASRRLPPPTQPTSRTVREWMPSSQPSFHGDHVVRRRQCLLMGWRRLTRSRPRPTSCGHASSWRSER